MNVISSLTAKRADGLKYFFRVKTAFTPSPNIANYTTILFG